MNTKQAILVSALETFEKYIEKHLDQTRSNLRVFSDDEELTTQFQEEFANRKFLINYIRDLAEEMNQTGYAITDSTTPDNRRLIETLENL